MEMMKFEPKNVFAFSKKWGEINVKADTNMTFESFIKDCYGWKVLFRFLSIFRRIFLHT